MICILPLGIWYDNCGFWGEVPSLIKLELGNYENFSRVEELILASEETEKILTYYVIDQILINLRLNCYDASVLRMQEYSYCTMSCCHGQEYRGWRGTIPTHSTRVQEGSQYWLAIGTVCIQHLIKVLRIWLLENSRDHLIKLWAGFLYQFSDALNLFYLVRRKKNSWNIYLDSDFFLNCPPNYMTVRGKLVRSCRVRSQKA
jgi:hypothetical protein